MVIGGGSMMTWGHIIWIFFPIPLICLILLSLPNYRKLEQWGTTLVGKIFFTRVSVGLLYIRLVHVFIGASLLVFGVACRSIQLGFSSAHVPCSGWVDACTSYSYCRWCVLYLMLIYFQMFVALTSLLSNILCDVYQQHQQSIIPGHHVLSTPEKQCGTVVHHDIEPNETFG